MVPQISLRKGWYKNMSGSKYRSSNIIIQTILETILRAEAKTQGKRGIVKSHLIRQCGLKTPVAQNYLDKMVQAGYVELDVEEWGERTITLFRVTAKGKERHKWFVTINTELEGS